jgi:hypothetical protein
MRWGVVDPMILPLDHTATVRADHHEVGPCLAGGAQDLVPRRTHDDSLPRPAAQHARARNQRGEALAGEVDRAFRGRARAALRGRTARGDAAT